MSVRISARVWESNLSGSDLLLMLALADHADDEGVCWPSVPKVAAKARMSERTAQRAIRRLAASGYLAVKYNAGRGGANEYVVMPGGPVATYPQLHDGDNLTPPTGDNLTPVTPDDTGVVTQLRHRRGDMAMSPESSKNHQGTVSGRARSLRGGAQCPRHIGQSAANCSPCRSEALTGGVR